MPPRLSALPRLPAALPRFPNGSRLYATALSTADYAPPVPIQPPTQPPSHRAAALRKTQLHRTYLSLLRSTPLMLLFQHNNLKAVEWSALRRELATALTKASPNPDMDVVAASTKITMLKAGVFSSALRVAEYYDPAAPEGGEHGTSRTAYDATKKRTKHQLAPLLSGPIGVLTFPEVSPPHLKTALEILFPENGKPKKGMDPLAVAGMHKLALLAARVDGHVASGKAGQGRVMEKDRVRWLSALPTLEGLQGEIVAVLRSVGGGELVRSLESTGLGLARTVEGRRKMLDEEQNGEKKGEA